MTSVEAKGRSLGKDNPLLPGSDSRGGQKAKKEICFSSSPLLLDRSRGGMLVALKREREDARDAMHARAN